MTQNQLRYWELRWKQYYDSRQLELDWAKLQHEAAKLAETIRHNKADERLERQRNILEQQKISLEWSKLNETVRNNIVREGIDAYKAASDRWKKEQDVAQNLLTILQSGAIAVGQLKLDIEKAKNKTSIDYINTYTDATGEIWKAFGGGAAALAIGEGRALLASQEYDKVLDNVFNKYPDLEKVYSTLDIDGSAQSNTNPIRQRYVETYGPQADQELSDDAKKHLNYVDQKKREAEEGGRIIGFSNTQNSNTTTDTVSTGSVINSDTGRVPSHTSGGTDYTISGGHKSSGVIYA